MAARNRATEPTSGNSATQNAEEGVQVKQETRQRCWCSLSRCCSRLLAAGSAAAARRPRRRRSRRSPESCRGGADGGEAGTARSRPAEAGGTYRVDVETSFDFTADFDPTPEYTAVAWSFYNLFLRKLMSYKRTVGNGGERAGPRPRGRPPEVSEDGLTYTFTLKDGIMFGPPVSREITSQDIKYSFDRLANPDIGSFGYPLYYEVIEGFKEVEDGKAKSVSGIETPDDKTIVFHADEADR